MTMAIYLPAVCFPLLNFFRQLSDKQIDQITDSLSKRKKKEKNKKSPILCSNCGHRITSESDAIQVAGQHRHSFKNPAGIDYTIGCFSKANGCFTMGEPTLEFTWFPGYSWSYSACGKCYTHLGWFFQSGDSSFFGLILNRLTQNS